MASGDIRKWFLKQPAKNTPAAEPDASKEGDKNGTDGRYNSTSKFFSSSSPASQANDRNEESKASLAKSSAASSKRFKDALNVDSDDDEFAKPLPKKARNVGKSAEDESDEKMPSTGRGKGRGRGESNARGTQDMDIDASPVKAPAAGRGAGRGRGRRDSNAKGTQDMDIDASPAKPLAGGRGRGRGMGRGDASVASASTEEDPEPSPKKPASQAVPKPAPGGRGRGGAGGGGGGGGRGGGFNFGAREAPPHRGEKEIPEGAEDALAGLTFVISGTLDSLEREEAEHLIKTHGGRITGSVSKKTDYLLADEDIGGRKSQKAKELGVKFLTEDGLFDMIRKTKPMKSAASPELPVTMEPVKAVEVVKTPKPKTEVVKGKGKIENGSSSIVDNRKAHAVESESWPHKHRPQSINDIIGNQSIVKQVQDWLLQWEKHHGNAVTGKKGSSSTQKKAVLLSGQPGIGKTTTARLVCQLLGYEALEVNASDSRGKSDSNVKTGMGGKTSNTIKEMISNKSLAFGSKSDRKTVLIMDEVDGMSGGDRGGVADLIASIKSSHIPIICICNDKYSQKLKSLINYCLPLPFRKPTKQQMAKRLQQIAKKEGLEVDDLALEELSERVNGDMRMALNQLQYMSLRSRTLKYADVRTRLMASAKDEDVTPFSAVDKLLGFDGGRMRIDERMDAAMSDMDLVPLLVQENYLNYCPSKGGRDDSGTARMDAIARTASSIAEGDIVNVQIRRFRQWQHAQMGAFMSSIIPAAYIHGRREVLVQGERNFNRFGGWLGKNSTFGKKTRLLEDVHVHLLASRICEPTREAVRLDYLPLLSMHLTQPLHNLPKDEAVQQVVDVLEEYSLDQEDMDTIVGMSTLKGGEGLLEGVPAATKTALTKTYKQRQGDRRVRSADLLPVLSLPGSKKVSKKPARMNFMPAEDEENMESLEDSMEAEDEEEGNAAEDDDLEEKALALLTESRPGMTLTLDPAKTKAAGAGRGRGSGRGRGRGRDSSQPKTPKAPSAGKRKK